MSSNQVENAAPNDRRQWQTDSGEGAKASLPTTAATPVRGVPATPILDGRTRIAAQTPGGAALVFGTPARFHASPAGRRGTAVKASKPPASAARHTYEPTVEILAPPQHPRPDRPFADEDDGAPVDVARDIDVAPAPLAALDSPYVSKKLALDDVDAAAEHNDDEAELAGPVPFDNSFVHGEQASESDGVADVATATATSASTSVAPAAVHSSIGANMFATPPRATAARVTDELVVDTPYCEQRLASALARAAAANVPTPRAEDASRSQQFEGSRDELLDALDALDSELRATRARHAELVAAVADGKAVTVADAKQFVAEQHAAKAALDERHRYVLQLKQQLCDKDDEIGVVNARVRECEAELQRLCDANAGLEEMLAGYKRQVADKDAELASLRAEQLAMRARIDELLEQAKHNLAVRRRLNNEIQELKGNIRVYCRVRPLGPEEQKASEAAHSIAFPNDEEIRITTVERSNIGRGDKRKEWSFKFNRAFNTKCSQLQIFEEIGGLVQSALDGFNVCVFAYGQTGAGKTYTMEGPNALDMDEWSKGVIPRAVEQIFAYAAQQSQLGWNYEIETSFLEIYLDEVYDLLATESGTERSAGRNKLAVCQQRDGSVEVAGLTVEPVTTPEEVYELLKRAAMHRATASTQKNNRSSRSHSLFQMKLVGHNPETQASTEGTLNLVDLAGSERVAQSGATGEQLKEAQAINKSLSTLGDVIRAVGEGSGHVPYRNSKLTRLLQPFLGGNSKCLMFCNVSPAARDMSETIASLRFAEHVASCTLGALAKNTQH